MKNFNYENDKLKISVLETEIEKNIKLTKISTTLVNSKQFYYKTNYQQIIKLTKNKSHNSINAKIALACIKLQILAPFSHYHHFVKAFEDFVNCVILLKQIILKTKELKQKFWLKLSKLNSLKRRV